MDSLVDPAGGSTTGVLTARPRGELDEAIAALSDGWALGDAPRVEALLERAGPFSRSDLLELVYHEYCLADAMGAGPVPEDYYSRFPELKGDLARLIGLREVVERSGLRSWSSAPEDLPEPGDEVGPYRLLRELGKGGMAKVFLAEQSDLEDRLVVVKIATRPSLEATMLARAQHTHIVPVIRQANAEGGGLHLIAMPFVGGASLAAVLGEWANRGGGRTGIDFLEALDRVAAPESVQAPSQSAVRAMLGRLSYAKAVAWMIARMAEAMEHASRLGVTHGDLKPANILIAADGTPMLLDFNLAVDWRSSDAELGGVAGGTLAYMAPERLRALADPKSAPLTRPADRQKADLYSLGLVLREALSGRAPEVPRDYPLLREAAARLAQIREHADPRLWCALPEIPASLRPILARLLAPEPVDRYNGMGELATDLDLWGGNRRLLYARQKGGPITAVSRWARRHRRLLTGATMIVAITSAAALIANAWLNDRLKTQAEAKLATTWDPGDPAIFRPLRFGQWHLENDADAAHENLDRYLVLDSKDWRQRDEVKRLDEPDRADLEMWLMEQAWRYASALADRVDSPEDWRRALSLLERSPEWASLSSFKNLRATLRQRLEQPAQQPEGRPGASWLESYAAGLEAEGTSAEQAARHYAQVFAEKPEAFWASYRSSVVEARLGQYDQAANSLASCIRRRPANPALWTMRAGCLLGVAIYPTGPASPSLDPLEEALRCADRALTLDPDYRDALIVRCMIRNRLNLLDGQQADLARLRKLSSGQARSLPLGLSLLLSGIAGRDDVPTVRSENSAVQELIAEQLDRAGRTEDAIAAYDLVIAAEPDHLKARFERACLLCSKRRNEGMVEFASIVRHPRFEELVRKKENSLIAVFYLVETLLLKGDFEEARELAENAVEISSRLRKPGLPPSPMVAESCYTLARVLARKAKSEPKQATRAAELLDRAGRLDARLLEVRFSQDPMFEPARESITHALQEMNARRQTPWAIPALKP